MSDRAAAALDTNSAMLALGNEVTRHPVATVVKNRELPVIYNANHLAGINVSNEAEVDDLLALAENEFAHTRHRRFDVDFRTHPALIARLTLAGYEREDVLAFLLDGALAGSADHRDIRPVDSDADWEAFWSLMVMDWTESRERRGQPADEDVARAMWQSTRNKQPPMQYWLAYEGERPIAYFASWQGHQGVGQVEDLFTHPDYRNRGIAKSLIFHCVEESRKAGADRVVITADPTDTPMHIYASLGFRPVAIATNYLKKPAD